MLDLGGNILDPHWWRKAVIVSDYLQQELQLKVLEHRFLFNLALLDYDTPTQTFNLHNRQAEQARNGMLECLMPWVDSAKLLRDSLTQMRETYVAHFSDPQSEEGRRAIAKQLAIWKAKQKGHGKRRTMGY